MEKILERTFLFFALVLLLGNTFWLIKWLNANSMAVFQASASDFIEPVEISESAVLKNEEDDFKINAESAISIEFGGDIQEEVLFEKDVDKKLPIASLVKLMTALLVLENYDLTKEVVISKTAIEQVGEQGDLKEGQVLSVKNLLYIALIESSNRAAYALSEAIGEDNFVALMRNRAAELGLINTYFEDSTGLDEKSYSTANDLAKLSKYLFLNYPLFGEIIGLKEFYLYLPDGSFHHKLINTNELLGQYEIVGGKTGYTIAAKGCFMAIQKKSPEKYVIHVILGSEDRFSEMQKLINKFSDIQYKVSIIR